jgi:hemerythrin
MRVQWTKEHSVDDATIDEQHKRLFLQISALYDMVNRGQGREAFDDICPHLTEYVENHFSHEEKYMEDHGFPELDQHKQTHDSFREEFEALKKEADTAGKSPDMAKRLADFLSRWWVTHVDTVDMRYRDYIRDNKKSHPKDEPADYHETVQG